MKIDRQKIAQDLKKNAPKFGFWIGTACILWGTVEACRKTLKVQPVIDNHKEAMTKIQMESETGVLEKKEQTKKTASVFFKTTADMMKLYWKPTVLILGGVAMTSSSFVTVEKRNTGLTSALAVTTAAFDGYRKNIIEKYGERADVEARYSVQEEKIKGKKGEEPTTKYSIPRTNVPSEWAVLMDAEEIKREAEEKHQISDIPYDRDPSYLLSGLKSIQNAIQMKLSKSMDGTVSVAEVYNLLRIVPKNADVANAIRVMGYEAKDFQKNDDGLPNWNLSVATVWPTAEIVTVDILQSELNHCVLNQEPFDRLDMDYVWVDLPKPKVIV